MTPRWRNQRQGFDERTCERTPVALPSWNDGTSYNEKLRCFIPKSTTVWKSAPFSKLHCGPELGISPHNCSMAPTMMHKPRRALLGRAAEGGCPHVDRARACIPLLATLFL